DLFHAAQFLVTKRPLTLDEKAAPLLDADARARLSRLSAALAEVPWASADIEQAVRHFAHQENIKLGDVAQPLRAALTGSAASPSLFEVLVALGREESLARLADQAS
ncbi:MAG: glutamate--tRNA ligase, partial [Propylenella sp.]